MNKKTAHSSSRRSPPKEIALKNLGVASSKRVQSLAQKVEFVEVRAGRSLQTKGRRAPAMLVGVSGAVLITDDDGAVVRVAAPFVVDSWATDHQRIATVTTVTESPSTLLLVDWRYRDAVFAAAPLLPELSLQTQAACTSTTSEIIDLTDDSSRTQPIQQIERRNHVSTRLQHHQV